MATLNELLAQRQALEKQIADAQREERAAAISTIRQLMSDFGLTAADINGRGAAPTSARSTKGVKTGKVAAKYRDTATGQTWSGRGLQPNWLKSALAAGKSLSDFAV